MLQIHFPKWWRIQPQVRRWRERFPARICLASSCPWIPPPNSPVRSWSDREGPSWRRRRTSQRSSITIQQIQLSHSKVFIFRKNYLSNESIKNGKNLQAFQPFIFNRNGSAQLAIRMQSELSKPGECSELRRQRSRYVVLAQLEALKTFAVPESAR